jgi:hypothetical protein
MGAWPDLPSGSAPDLKYKQDTYASFPGDFCVVPFDGAFRTIRESSERLLHFSQIEESTLVSVDVLEDILQRPTDLRFRNLIHVISGQMLQQKIRSLQWSSFNFEYRFNRLSASYTVFRD